MTETGNPDTEGVSHELHKFWWLYLPILFFTTRYLVHLFSGPHTGPESWFRNELGIVENLTVLLLVLALCYAISVIFRFRRDLHFIPNMVLVLFCLGCIYFAGEEASWGQHWFGWQTGEYFQQANDQHETNFHNTSVWLDRLPKGIVSLLIFVGGIVIPLLFRYKGLRIDPRKPLWWLWPTWISLPVAIIATVATWPSKIERATGWQFYFDQAQETKEVFIAYFILLYIVSLSIRLNRLRQNNEKFAPL